MYFWVTDSSESQQE